jgi:hypothetical protein
MPSLMNYDVTIPNYLHFNWPRKQFETLILIEPIPCFTFEQNTYNAIPDEGDPSLKYIGLWM